MDLHYFIFTDGEDHHYRIAGLYACDHPVSHDDWKIHLQNCNAEEDRRREDLYARIDSIPRNSTDYELAWKVFNDWQKENEPMQKFIELHRMLEVEHQEFHQP